MHTFTKCTVHLGTLPQTVEKALLLQGLLGFQCGLGGIIRTVSITIYVDSSNIKTTTPTFRRKKKNKLGKPEHSLP